MSRIAVIGGTGYAGRNIVSEAKERGHAVVSVSRSEPEQPQEGVTYRTGTLLDVPALVETIGDADVVIFATSPRGEMAGRTRPAIAETIAALPAGVRVGVIGGAGGSLVAPGGPRVIDGEFPAEFADEAREMAAVLEDLQAAGPGHDWFLIHPAGGFGPWNDHERRGTYRDGGDVIVTDADGESNIGGADFGIAVLDEIETPKHVGERFTVGY
ncbi:NAD(P)-dependent oxidoreductase [Microbacterium gorillae]|uniref:NAD(P)-dependent oxidoreductase n=1 Tax=Microbacterium gorillae TaxID=1231063 RepID=UPI000590A1D3|nr:NAD(P)H-binding protein [Microbacterium gorillae]